MKAAPVRGVWLAGVGVRRMFNLAKALRRHDLPDTFFVRVTDFDRDMEALRRAGTRRKPMWIDSQSPASVEAFSRIVAEAETIELTEVLPTIDETSAAFVHELQLELVLRGERAAAGVSAPA